MRHASTSVLSLAVVVLGAGCGSGAVGGTPDGFGTGGSTTSVGSGSKSASGGGSDDASAGTSFTTASTGSSGDCNGANQEGCGCTTAGQTQSCYAGAMSQAGIGACTLGTQTCVLASNNEIDSQAWGACVGSGAPVPEICGDGIDNDCNGLVDDNCASCTDGQTQSCTDTDGSQGTETCSGGSWGPCSCTNGQSQSCVDTTGQSGASACVNGVWGPCVIPGTTNMVGQPCIPGTGAPSDPSDPSCQYGGLGSTLYCDSTGTYQCFPNSGCTQDACTACLQMNCSQYETSTTCPSQLAEGWTWLTECAPDRSNYFSDLENACPDVQELNGCKFQYCINGTDANGNEAGPCNLY